MGPGLVHPVGSSSSLAFILLAAGFTLAYLVMTVIAVHLLTLLQAQGLALVAAVGLGALIGPLQVGGWILPLAVFGPGGYGARQGLIGAPARLLQAASPFLFGLVLEQAGVQAALTLTTGCSLLALLALVLLRPASPSVLPAKPA